MQNVAIPFNANDGDGGCGDQYTHQLNILCGGTEPVGKAPMAIHRIGICEGHTEDSDHQIGHCQVDQRKSEIPSCTSTKQLHKNDQKIAQQGETCRGAE